MGQSYHTILQYLPSNHKKLTLKTNNIKITNKKCINSLKPHTIWGHQVTEPVQASKSESTIFNYWMALHLMLATFKLVSSHSVSKTTWMATSFLAHKIQLSLFTAVMFHSPQWLMLRVLPHWWSQNERVPEPEVGMCQFQKPDMSVVGSSCHPCEVK